MTAPCALHRQHGAAKRGREGGGGGGGQAGGDAARAELPVEESAGPAGEAELVGVALGGGKLVELHSKFRC